MLHKGFLSLTDMKIPQNAPRTYRAAHESVCVGRDDTTSAPSKQLATVRYPSTTSHLEKGQVKDYHV